MRRRKCPAGRRRIMAEQTQKEITEHGYSEPEKYTTGSIEELLDKMNNQEDEK